MLKKLFDDKTRIYFLILENLKMESAPIFFEDFHNFGNFQNRKVFFDLSLLSFVDSSGIGVLIRVSDFLKDRNSNLYLVNIRKNMESIFRLAGLNQIFDLLDSEGLKNFFNEDELLTINKGKL